MNESHDEQGGGRVLGGDTDVGAAARDLAVRFGRPFRQGEVFFRDGDPVQEAFLLVEGKVRVLKRVRLNERSLGVLRAGDIFGEGALRSASIRTTTAIALGDGLVVALDVRAMREVVETAPILATRILSELVRRLGEAEDQIEVLMLRDTQSKVVSALLKMARSARDEGGGATVALSPVELASRVGLDVETVKRTVQRLREQQYLRIVGERVEIPDLDALRRLYALLGAKEEVRGER